MINDSKYIVFWDVDGVATSQRVETACQWPNKLMTKFDPIAIEFFNRIHDSYSDVSFVMISTWRNHLPQDETTLHWVKSALANAGFRGRMWDHDGVWRVNPENDLEMMRKGRAGEIKDYLVNYTGVDLQDYIIFDDNDYLFNQVLDKRRFVKTDPENGLLWKHMKNALSIMGNWEKK